MQTPVGMKDFWKSRYINENKDKDNKDKGDSKEIDRDLQWLLSELLANPREILQFLTIMWLDSIFLVNSS